MILAMNLDKSESVIFILIF